MRAQSKVEPVQALAPKCCKCTVMHGYTEVTTWRFVLAPPSQMCTLHQLDRVCLHQVVQGWERVARGYSGDGEQHWMGEGQDWEGGTGDSTMCQILTPIPSLSSLSWVARIFASWIAGTDPRSQVGQAGARQGVVSPLLRTSPSQRLP